MLVDTHCHIHEPVYPLDPDQVISRAHQAGVTKMVCVGTSQSSSHEAVTFAREHAQTYAAVGVHPHETKEGWGDIAGLLTSSSGIVAVGEVGLDYYYTHSPRDTQILALEAQLDMAVRHGLPVIFHVRNAFDDFWPIFDNFHNVRGVLHSFTDTPAQLEQGLKRGLFIGVNGISTFTKDAAQRAMFASIPLHRLLLETDAPFLTPVPLRGNVNEPAFVKTVAEFQAAQRGLQFDELAAATTANATALFAL